MDIAEQAQYMVIGQADVLSLHKLPNNETVWEKSFDNSEAK